MVVELEQIISLPVWEGVAITLILLSAICVSMRVFINITGMKKFGFDDGIAISAVLFSASTFAVNTIIIKGENDPTKSAFWQVQLGVVIVILVQFALWTSKAPILLLYRKIFGVHQWLRYGSYITIFVMTIAYVVGLALAVSSCSLKDPDIDFVAQLKCNAGNTRTGIISGFTSIFVDATIFILPIPVIVNLRLPPSKKIVIGAVFLSGVFGIVASIVSQYYKWQAWKGRTTDFTITILALQIECSVGIMVSCAPGLKAFWTTHISRHAQSVKSKYIDGTTSFVSRPSARLRRLKSKDSGLDTTLNGESYALRELEERTTTPVERI